MPALKLPEMKITDWIKLPAILIAGWIMFLVSVLGFLFVFSRLRIFKELRYLFDQRSLARLAQRTNRTFNDLWVETFQILNPVLPILVDIDVRIGLIVQRLGIERSYRWARRGFDFVAGWVSHVFWFLDTPFLPKGEGNTFWLGIAAVGAIFGSLGGIVAFYDKLTNATNRMLGGRGDKYSFKKDYDKSKYDKE